MKYFNNVDLWNDFLTQISSGIKTNNKGETFEILVDKLLKRLFSPQNIEFFSTKKSHDGSKDFWAIDNNDDLWWAECKNRNEHLGLKELSPTLFMAELYEINHILFFSYSKLNSNVLRKIGLYATKHNKRVFVFDDERLEYIIFKLLPLETEKFANSIESPSSTIIDTFHEKNPLLFNSNNFDGFYTIDEIEVGEIYNSNTLIINSQDAPIDIEATILVDESFRVVDKCKVQYKMEPFELFLVTFKIQLISNNKQVIEFPQISINSVSNKKKNTLNHKCSEKKYNCKKGHNDILVGEHYENIIKRATEACLENKLSAFLVYGCGGSGKTRILHECYLNLLSSNHKILNFTNFDSSNNWKDVIREITYNIFSIEENIALDLLCRIEDTEVDNVDFNLDPEKKTVFKLLTKLNKENTTAEEISVYYKLIFEKMRQGKYAIIVDNFQSYSIELVSFFEKMLNFYMSCNRRTDICLLFSINTNLIFENAFLDFISKIINNKSNLLNLNFICEEILGFETVEQAIVFLNSKLYLTNFPLHDELKKEIVNRGTLKPKYLEQVAEYLINSGCVAIKGFRGIVSDELKCRHCLSNIPSDYKHLMKYNYNCILKVYPNKDEYFKKIFATIFLFGKVSETLIEFFNLDFESIIILEKHGLIKNIGFRESPQYVMEHDLTADCISTYIYNDLIIVASNMVVECCSGNKLLIDEHIIILSKLVNGDISTKDFLGIRPYILEMFPNRLKWFFAYYYVKNCLKNFFVLDESSLECVNVLCKYIDDQISTSKAEELFALAYKAVSKIIPSNNKMINQLFSFYIHMAENKIHQRDYSGGLSLYDQLEDKLRIFLEDSEGLNRELKYAFAYVSNRRFVCGKLEGNPVKYLSNLKSSRKICLENEYWDIEFENCFDEANIYINDSKEKFISCIETGFAAFRKSKIHQKEKYMPNFLYKKIQLLCIEQNFDKAKRIADKALKYIQCNSNVNYHLFFKTKYLKYKIICMLETNDIENISQVLQEYSITLDLYGEIDNFEVLYFKALYYLIKNDKECLWLLFEKMYNTVSNINNPQLNYIYMIKDLAMNISEGYNHQLDLNDNNPHLKEINNILLRKKQLECSKLDTSKTVFIFGKNKRYKYYF